MIKETKYYDKTVGLESDENECSTENCNMQWKVWSHPFNVIFYLFCTTQPNSILSDIELFCEKLSPFICSYVWLMLLWPFFLSLHFLLRLVLLLQSVEKYWQNNAVGCSLFIVAAGEQEWKTTNLFQHILDIHIWTDHFIFTTKGHSGGNWTHSRIFHSS